MPGPAATCKHSLTVSHSYALPREQQEGSVILNLSEFKVELETSDLLDVALSHCFKGQEQFLLLRVTFKHFGFHHLFNNAEKGTKTRNRCRSKRNIIHMENDRN